MNEDFIKIIDDDIQKCENELKKGNKESKYRYCSRWVICRKE